MTNRTTNKGSRDEALSFNPKEATKGLLHELAPRVADVLKLRYGLGKESTRMTLEAIGKKYDITRERVRQIENFGIRAIVRSGAYEKCAPLFAELHDRLQHYGGIVHESLFLNALAKDKATQNHLHFLLVVGEQFSKLKEDDEFHHRWTTDPAKAERVHGALRKLCQNFSESDLVHEHELVARFLKEIKGIVHESEDPELIRHWLSLSKVLGQNPLGEWGLAKSPNVHARGMRDYAYLVIRSEGKPLHFTEVTNRIKSTFGKKAHTATCHNELIKDKRFVLVGRGLYALSEWGYQSGVVRDVIERVLRTRGPLAKDTVITEVLKERLVKPNTIIVNLQNPRYFKRSANGLYSTL